MSNNKFRTRIRSALDNLQLQSALDANAERRGHGRVAASATLPDWKERRQRAHSLRAFVVDHLEELLHTFGKHAEQNGMRVHRAASAAEAAGLVLRISEAANGRAIAADDHERRPLLFAKAKSMLAEEIDLNTQLVQHGHRVVETDLGEYIVQLRGERPAHIITPAVHLNRQQVGRLFQENLGIEYTDDISTLTAAARAALREIFLTADVGISGVNFGVADTGTLCIVTNEGNGRMVTTLPQVHIALMGMERLVPSLDDLALMLSLLPRSATGQKLTVYTQLIRAARGNREVGGPQERHVIIVDNGRSALARSRLREALYCIRCGACLNACPVFREIGGHAYVGSGGEPAPYPGPIGSIISPGLAGLSGFGQLSQASSLCGACKDACPVDIDLPMLLTRVRAGSPEVEPTRAGVGLSTASRLGLGAYGMLASSPRLFSMFQHLAAVMAHLVFGSSQWIRVPAFTGWGASKDFPRPARRPFRVRWRERDRAVEQSLFDGTRGSAPAQSSSGAVADFAQVTHALQRLSGDDSIQRFVDELGALGATTKRVPGEQLQATLIAFLQQRAIETVWIGEPIQGVSPTDLQAAGVQPVEGIDPNVRAGMTGCECAIADTGTLVLASGPGKALAASLLPEIHIAIVRAAQIVASLEEAMRLQTVTTASSTVLITGPSRTADIEMTLTIGVHGPKELVVYIVE